VSKSYQFTKLRHLSVRICAINYLRYRLNIANITKKILKSKHYVVLFFFLSCRWKIFFTTMTGLLPKQTENVVASIFSMSRLWDHSTTEKLLGNYLRILSRDTHMCNLWRKGKCHNFCVDHTVLPAVTLYISANLFRNSEKLCGFYQKVWEREKKRFPRSATWNITLAISTPNGGGSIRWYIRIM
jgi:hypothetical protein